MYVVLKGQRLRIDCCGLRPFTSTPTNLMVFISLLKVLYILFIGGGLAYVLQEDKSEFVTSLYTRNAKTFAPKAGNQQEFKILGDIDESAPIKRLISFHVIYNRYTVLD